MSEAKVKTSEPPGLAKPNPSSNGILKFINQKNSYQRPEGKKCNPYRQFGVSSDAPRQFCLKNTLISQAQKFKQFNKNSTQRPQFFSQKDFITIGHGKRPVTKQQNNFIKQYNKAVQQNKLAFHHKTSNISNFYDKNAWMGSRFFVMGHERSQNALELNKNQIQFRTRSSRSLNLSKKRSMTPATTTFRTSIYPTHESMKQLILSQKARIRTMRNSLANYYKPQQQQNQKRPQTSFQYTSNIRKLSLGQNSFKKQTLQKNPRQFEINLPQWQQKQFNVNFIDWQPETNRKSGKQRQAMSPQKMLGIQTNRSNRFQLQN